MISSCGVAAEDHKDGGIRHPYPRPPYFAPMIPFLLDSPDGTINKRFYVLSIRTGYLLAGSVTITDEHLQTYSFIHTLGNATEKEKLIVLKSAMKGEERQVVLETEQILKNLRTRRLGAKEIVAKKQFERIIDQMFQAWVQNAQKFLYEHYGYMEIDEEFLKTGVLSTFKITDDGAEKPGAIAMSRVFLRNDGVDDDDETMDPGGMALMMLPDEFFDWCEGKHTIYDAASNEANNTNNIFLHTCFTLPDTSKVPVEEMKLARRTLEREPATTQWTHAHDEWLWSAIKSPEGMVARFTSDVAVHNAPMQQAIDSNPVLQHITRSRPQGEALQVMLGLVPRAHILSFYRDMKVISDQSWQVIQDAIANGTSQPRRDPVFALRFVGEKYFKTDDGEEEMHSFNLLRRRKVLSVD